MRSTLQGYADATHHIPMRGKPEAERVCSTCAPNQAEGPFVLSERNTTIATAIDDVAPVCFWAYLRPHRVQPMTPTPVPETHVRSAARELERLLERATSRPGVAEVLALNERYQRILSARQRGAGVASAVTVTTTDSTG